MIRRKQTERLACFVLALMLLLTGCLMGIPARAEDAGRSMGYESRLFDQSRVHTIDIRMEDWSGFLAECTDEEYVTCTVTVDGETFSPVAIRAKGNTSLSNVASYGNDRYSFKIEFDHYDSGLTYYGLDKLSLNNLIQDNTLMKDYLAYTMMGKMGIAAPLCSYVQIRVNGEEWGLYLAVECVEESFLLRNYGADQGELYKPDSMSMGGGRGNGADFDMDAAAEDMVQAQTDSIPDAAPAEGLDGMMPAAPAEGLDGMMPAAPAEGFDGMMPAAPAEGLDGMMPAAPAEGFEGAMPAMPAGEFGGRMTEGFGGETFAGGMANGGDGGKSGRGSADVKLQYIDDDPESYPNIFENAKTDITDGDAARLIDALKKLSQGDASAVDREQVAMYMAVHNFLCNGDSYTGSMVHNYYLYEKDGRLSMIPWDYNLAFGGFDGGDAASLINAPIDTLVTSGAVGDRPMADWITADEESLQLYHDAYAAMVEDLYHSGWIIGETERVRDMIRPYVETDPTKFCTAAEFETGADTLILFCEKRFESVSGQLSGTIPSTRSGQTGSHALIGAEDISISDMGGMHAGGNRIGGDQSGITDRRNDRQANAGSGGKTDRESPVETENAAAPAQQTAESDNTDAPVQQPAEPDNTADPAQNPAETDGTADTANGEQRSAARSQHGATVANEGRTDRNAESGANVGQTGETADAGKTAGSARGILQREAQNDSEDPAYALMIVSVLVLLAGLLFAGWYRPGR